MENKMMKTVSITIYTIVWGAGIYLFFKYLFSCAAPFLCSFVLAYISRPVVMFLCKKYRFTRFAAVLSTTTIILFFSICVIWLIFSTIFSELSSLTLYLGSGNVSQNISDISASVINLLNDYLPYAAEIIIPRFEYLSKNADIMLTEFISAILPHLGSTALSAISSFPGIMLFTVVTLLSFFYFSCDYERIVNFIKAQIPKKRLDFASELKTQFFDTIFRIIKAYTIIILLTFTELLVGFSILGIPYAMLLSFIISLIDILPVLGTGTVLIPWGIVKLISGNTKTGLCIIAIYVIITMIRQAAEPKILGNSVGLHPLLTLLSMYFGIKLFGISGLFFVPLAVIIVKNLNEKGFVKLYNAT